MQHLQPNTTLQGGKYRIERVLGQGGFGNTYRAIMQDRVSGKLGAMEIEVPVAIKEFFISGVNDRKDNTIEVIVSNSRCSFSCPTIIAVYSFFYSAAYKAKKLL